ncbi:MAG TPA: hypothetical protein VF134_08610 [Candidatus Dormibacteraeota bacterium]
MTNPRRAVLDNARRQVERALMVGEAADELASAAEAVLGSDSEPSAEREALAKALERYRKVAGL